MRTDIPSLIYAPQKSLNDEIREAEEECALLWSEIEPLLKAHDAMQKKLIELYRKDVA